VLYLQHFSVGYETREIAKLLGWTEAATWSIRQRSLGKVKKMEPARSQLVCRGDRPLVSRARRKANRIAASSRSSVSRTCPDVPSASLSRPWVNRPCATS
jgi:hypothetical protein